VIDVAVTPGADDPPDAAEPLDEPDDEPHAATTAADTTKVSARAIHFSCG
jgi:hypothetical protein